MTTSASLFQQLADEHGLRSRQDARIANLYSKLATKPDTVEAEMVTLKVAAQMLSVGLKTVKNMVAADEIHEVKTITNKRFVSVWSIRSFINGTTPKMGVLTDDGDNSSICAPVSDTNPPASGEGSLHVSYLGSETAGGLM